MKGAITIGIAVVLSLSASADLAIRSFKEGGTTQPHIQILDRYTAAECVWRIRYDAVRGTFDGFSTNGFA